MTKSSLPTVGFDRFVTMDWLDQTLHFAITGQGIPTLKAWLNEKITGKDAARKTSNLLTNLWLREYSETRYLRNSALKIARDAGPQERIVLHWGMCLANFSLFRNTTAIIGRFLRLQGNFLSTEVRQRISEIYGNQGTIPRCVSRIIQSLDNWNIITLESRNQYIATEDIPVTDTNVLGWLIEALLTNSENQQLAISDVLRSPVLFPFDTMTNGMQAVQQSPSLSIIREGMNQDYVLLQENTRNRDQSN